MFVSRYLVMFHVYCEQHSNTVSQFQSCVSNTGQEPSFLDQLARGKPIYILRFGLQNQEQTSMKSMTCWNPTHDGMFDDSWNISSTITCVKFLSLLIYQRDCPRKRSHISHQTGKGENRRLRGAGWVGERLDAPLHHARQHQEREKKIGCATGILGEAGRSKKYVIVPRYKMVPYWL